MRALEEEAPLAFRKRVEDRLLDERVRLGEIEKPDFAIARRGGEGCDRLRELALPGLVLRFDADQAKEFEAPDMHRHDDEIDIAAIRLEAGEPRREHRLRLIERR